MHKQQLLQCQTIGSLGLLGCLFFAVYLLFFGHQYQLGEHHLPNEQAAALRSGAPELFATTFQTHISFLSATEKAMQAHDAQIKSQYSLSEAQQKAFVSKHTFTDAPFVVSDSMLVVLSQSAQTKDVQSFQATALQRYGNWLIGRSYTTADALANDLAQVAENISKYGIPADKSPFPSWERNNIKLQCLRKAATSPYTKHAGATTALFFGILTLATLAYLLPRYQLDGTPGIKHHGIYHHPKQTRIKHLLVATALIAFYIVLYFYPHMLGPWVILMDPLSVLLNGGVAGHFFLYGLLYSVAILLMGIRMFIKYRHSLYHRLRTGSLMFFQFAFAFLLPEFLVRMNRPYFDFKNIWPLDYDFFFDTELSKLMAGGGLGLFMLGWGLALIVIGVPVLTYFFGKRWYCSWVCGCGGLAETLGDPYRQLSDKSLRAWKIERWSVHGVLVLAVATTAAVLYTYWSGEARLLGIDSYQLRHVYGFYIGALFSGVIGTGFYPLMGSRVWCRFGCPLAAYLGLIQRFRSRFRITTNGGQCISCGNCSTYCEMGIDVRHYAQRGQPIVRASCVGCGVCASVCPRGVLRLENSSKNRTTTQLLGHALGEEQQQHPL